MNAVMGATLRRVGEFLSGSGGDRSLSILIYHHVLPGHDPLQPGEVDRDQFTIQLEVLSSCFNVLSLADAVRRLKERTLPPRAACITFDDGYRDNATVAMPILHSFGLTATFFLATGYLEGGRMWNDTIIESVRSARDGELDLTDLGLGHYELLGTEGRRHAITEMLGALKYLPQSERQSKVDEIAGRVGADLPDDLMMSEGDVAKLVAGGMDIGAHTISHPILARVSQRRARDEIFSSLERTRELADTPVTLFAYPNGKPGTDYTRRDVDLVRSAGCEAAVSTAWGVGRRSTDNLQLPRFTPWDRSRTKFALRLLQNYRQKRVEFA